MLNKNKRIQIAIIMGTISLLIIVAIFLFLRFGFYNNKVVALVGNERIYENEIKDELLEMFPNSDPSTFELAKLPHPVLELMAKGIFVKKEIYKEAKRAMINKDKTVKAEIDKYSERVISEYYLTSMINKKLTNRALSEKYAELSDQMQDGKQYRISVMLFPTKEAADAIIKRLNSHESFENLVQKNSLNALENKNGDLGYLSSKDIKKEFLIVDSMKKGEFSQPIKTDQGWYIIKLTGVRTVELGDFASMKGKLMEEIKKEEINRIFSRITKHAEVKILI